MAKSLPDNGERAKPKFLEQVRIILRTRHYSLRTEEAYLGWIRALFSSMVNATRRKWGRPRWRRSSITGR